MDDFIQTLKDGKSKVKQMIMGQGKTTVVAPILALMLADGRSLVLSVVPQALLEMSRKLMRETFATIMAKRVFTLKFDRSTVIKPVCAHMLVLMPNLSAPISPVVPPHSHLCSHCEGDVPVAARSR